MDKEETLRKINENWLDKNNEFQSKNFTKSLKNLDIKNGLIENSKFLVENVSWTCRYKYIKNNILIPNKCITCGKEILDRNPDETVCSIECGRISPIKIEKIKLAKKIRDESSPFNEMTLAWWIWKYGETEGTRKYKDRNSKILNTEENLILKYGETLGKDKYEKFKCNISYSNSLEGKIERYGLIEGSEKYNTNIKKKSMSLENFKRIYGEIEGIKRYELFKENRNNPKQYSKISQKLFWILYKTLVQKDHIYFGELNKEFNKGNNMRSFYYDFVDTKNKKIIEFNGDKFHANPQKYKENDIPLKHINKTARELWDYDLLKHNLIKSYGYTILVIWESDFMRNEENIISNCISFLLNNENQIEYII